MPIEIEAKMALHDAGGFEQRLRYAGAQLAGQLIEHNQYFDTKDHALKSTDQGLRVRTLEPVDADGQPTPAVDRTITMTHKGPRAHGLLKSRSEHEVDVANADDAAKLLAALGYYPVMSFEKRRALWQIDGCEVAVDHLPYLGDFVEIEGPSDDAVIATRDKLGLADAPLIQASYISLLNNHLNENNIDSRDVKLEIAPVA